MKVIILSIFVFSFSLKAQNLSCIVGERHFSQEFDALIKRTDFTAKRVWKQYFQNYLNRKKGKELARKLSKAFKRYLKVLKRKEDGHRKVKKAYYQYIAAQKNYNKFVFSKLRQSFQSNTKVSESAKEARSGKALFEDKRDSHVAFDNHLFNRILNPQNERELDLTFLDFQDPNGLKYKVNYLEMDPTTFVFENESHHSVALSSLINETLKKDGYSYQVKTRYEFQVGEARPIKSYDVKKINQKTGEQSLYTMSSQKLKSMVARANCLNGKVVSTVPKFSSEARSAGKETPSDSKGDRSQMVNQN